MRRIVVLGLIVVCCLSTAVSAEKTLKLSESTLAIKLTDPQKMLTTLSPALDILSGLISLKVTDKALLTPEAVHENISKLAKIPGIDAKGDVWIVVCMPEQPAEGAAKGDRKMELNFNGRPTTLGVVPRATMNITGGIPPTYVIAPLRDGQSFTAAMKALEKPNGLVCGKYALLALDGTLPDYTAVVCDITPTLRYPLALCVPNTGGKITALSPDIERWELGMGVVGKSLVAESCSVSKPGSMIAIYYAAVHPGTVGVDCARYLPENLAYCKAGGPVNSGSVGLIGSVMNYGARHIVTDDEQFRPLFKNLGMVLEQCQQGRAFGVLPPAGTDPKQWPTMVAVYRLTKPKEMQDATSMLVAQIIPALDQMTNGWASKIADVTYAQGKEQVGKVPVNLCTINASIGQLAGLFIALTGNKPEGEMPDKLTIEFRLAFTDNLLLFTMGERSKEEMAALIKRVGENKIGFTGTPAFKQVKALLPADAGGFEYFATLPCARALLATTHPDDLSGVKSAMEKLNALKPPTSAIYSFQHIRNGSLHTEIRIPLDQAPLLSILLNAPDRPEPDKK